MIWYSIYVLVGFVGGVIASKVIDGKIILRDLLLWFLLSLIFRVFLFLIGIHIHLKENNKYEDWGSKKIF